MGAVTGLAASVEMKVPDIGDFNNVPVIEVLVKAGDVLALEDPVATLESEKATLDVPASIAGRVVTVAIKPGMRVSKGSVILTLEPLTDAQTSRLPEPESSIRELKVVQPSTAPPSETIGSIEDLPLITSGQESATSRIYAGPSVRRLGRELGVDMTALKGSGRGGRVLAADIHAFVRTRIASPAFQFGPHAVAPTPSIDFAKFGEIERQPLSRIRKISGATLAHNWRTIPHVTNFDEADITELDRFRERANEARQADTAKISVLSFLMKAAAVTLKLMPTFNASLDGDTLVLKKYFHIGAAVDTSGGLLVPVLRNVDQMGVRAIANALSTKAAAAREGKLKVADMEGGCFTVSSLGGVGGLGFTPIINAPEVAILGAGKARVMPRWDGAQFAPRLILPLCLSWDHRALDGVAAARFLVHLVQMLEDFRLVSL